MMKQVLWWLWLAVDLKGCLMSTTTEKEREEMGIRFDN